MAAGLSLSAEKYESFKTAFDKEARRLLTLEDTVEFFNLVLETELTNAEKQDLVAFLRQL